MTTDLKALRASHDELLAALKWFIDDIDGTHTVMLDFDANVTRARAAIAKAQRPNNSRIWSGRLQSREGGEP